jgi:hypothetical protein
MTSKISNVRKHARRSAGERIPISVATSNKHRSTDDVDDVDDLFTFADDCPTNDQELSCSQC